MDQNNTAPSRKKFLIWSATLLSSVAALNFIPGSNKKKKESQKETVKMLTQDGRLVEIDKTVLPSKRNKITDDDLKTWVKK